MNNNIEEFVRKFAEQFDDTDASQFSADTNFRELEEWSSMHALAVIAMVDEEYQVKLKGNDIRESATIKDIFERVVSLTTA